MPAEVAGQWRQAAAALIEAAISNDAEIFQANLSLVIGGG